MFLTVLSAIRRPNQLVFSKCSSLFFKLPLVTVFLFVVFHEIKQVLRPSDICRNCREKAKKRGLLGVLDRQDLAELQMVSCWACISRCSEENCVTWG